MTIAVNIFNSFYELNPAMLYLAIFHFIKEMYFAFLFNYL